MSEAAQGFMRRRTVEYVDDLNPRRTKRIAKIIISANS